MPFRHLRTDHIPRRNATKYDLNPHNLQGQKDLATFRRNPPSCLVVYFAFRLLLRFCARYAYVPALLGTIVSCGTHYHPQARSRCFRAFCEGLVPQTQRGGAINRKYSGDEEMSESGRKKRITQAQSWKDEAQGRVDQAIGDLHTWKGLQDFRDPSTT